MKREWQTPVAVGTAGALLAKELGIPRSLANVLVSRGFAEAEAARVFLDPKLASLSDSLELPGMVQALELVLRARAECQTVVIYGDYDVDGVTATALLAEQFQKLGMEVRTFLPNRLDDGYGLRVEPLRRCLEEHRPGLLITVDCGTNSAEAVRVAQQAGVRVIVTDHHQPGPELAPADALVNPRLGDASRPWYELAGVGVAYKLAHAVIRECARQEPARTEELRAQLKQSLDLVALGTIADCVPLCGENRTLAAIGMKTMANPDRLGLRELKEVAKIPDGKIRSYDVAFLLAPRLNAAGRLESAEASLELLRTTDPMRARECARNLNDANRERRAIQSDTVKQAEDWIRLHTAPEMETGLVVADSRWHPGVVGIVAARLAGIFRVPVVVLALDGEGVARGSARSIEGVHLVECLNDCREVLRASGGHAMAAGVTLDAARVDEFREAFRKATARRVTPELRQPKLILDAVVNLQQVDVDLADALLKMEPFGQGNPEPVWFLKNVQFEEPRKVGEHHLQMMLRQGPCTARAIGFGMAEIKLPDRGDVAFTIRKDEWKGRERAQITLKGIQE